MTPAQGDQVGDPDGNVWDVIVVSVEQDAVIIERTYTTTTARVCRLRDIGEPGSGSQYVMALPDQDDSRSCRKIPD